MSGLKLNHVSKRGHKWQLDASVILSKFYKGLFKTMQWKIQIWDKNKDH